MERQFANTDELTINALMVPLPPLDEVLPVPPLNRHIVAFDWTALPAFPAEPVSFALNRQFADSDAHPVSSLIPLRG